MAEARCSCGALTLTLPGPPKLVVACHCLECQRRTGAPFGVGAFYPANTVGISGTAREFTRDAASGGKVHTYFCPNCGSTVYWKAGNLPSLIGVATGALADPGCPAPVKSVFEQSKHGWVRVDGAVEHFQQSSVAKIQTGTPPLMPFAEQHVPAMLALNNAHPAEVSVLDEAGLRALLAQAIYAPVIGGVDAFMVVLDQAAEYASPNFAWCRARYPRFAYVDRLVVAPAARGRGLARQMYAGLFRAAAEAGHGVVLCEVNQEPPNPASDALHKALGFQPVGTATVYGGTRTVQYLARQLPP